MPADKPIGLSVEQIRWLPDGMRARIYGEPIGNEAVAEILETCCSSLSPACAPRQVKRWPDDSREPRTNFIRECIPTLGAAGRILARLGGTRKYAARKLDLPDDLIGRVHGKRRVPIILMEQMRLEAGQAKANGSSSGEGP
jgi:hypothetical protein